MNTDKASSRVFILPLLFTFCALFYYLGEIVDIFGWETLRLSFFYSVHDVHRLLFLAPVIYAGYVARVKGAVILTLVSFIVFLPRAFFISPYPDPVLRMALFTVILGAVGVLTGIARNASEQRDRLDALLREERDKLKGVLERMEDGVLLIGPDYRVRLTNSSMLRDFGQGLGSYCYQYLHKREQPCERICPLPAVLNGKVARWEYNFPDGRTYELVASPYQDTDGVVCQLVTLRDVTSRRKG